MKMETTDYHKKVLRCLSMTNLLNREKLAIKIHPDFSGLGRRLAIAHVTRAIDELEHANMVYCSNPDTDSWKITEYGRSELSCGAMPAVDENNT